MCKFIPDPILKDFIVIDIYSVRHITLRHIFSITTDAQKTYLAGNKFNLYATTLEALAIEFELVTGLEPSIISYPPTRFSRANSFVIDCASN